MAARLLSCRTRAGVIRKDTRGAKNMTERGACDTMVEGNPLKAVWAEGGCIGTAWLGLGALPVVEMAVGAGADAVTLDAQHGVWDRTTLEAAVGLIRGRAIPLVRVAENGATAIGQALDAGALGVIVPMVETADQARAAVAAAKYPPAGIRSAGGIRHLIGDFKAYSTGANDTIAVAVMIETARGVANAAEIAAVPGVDMLFIGAVDLAISMGEWPDQGPAFEATIQSIKATARAAGIACGIFTGHVSLALDRRRQGFQLVVVAEDVVSSAEPIKANIARFRPAADHTDPVPGAVAFVTGTNRGIGPHTVRQLLDGGAARIYCTARDPAAIADLIATAPDRLVPMALDITDDAQITAAAAAAADVTLLVNNAGVNHNSPLLAIDGTHRARQEIEVNYLGTLGMIRAFAPVLKANAAAGRPCAIVNMLSILSRQNLPAMGSLCASKAAEYSLTQGARAELAAAGVTVFAIMPGAVDTDMTRDFQGPKMPPAAVAEAIRHALSIGQGDVYPGDMAAGVAAGLALDPIGTEAMLARFLPPPFEG